MSRHRYPPWVRAFRYSHVYKDGILPVVIASEPDIFDIHDLSSKGYLFNTEAHCSPIDLRRSTFQAVERLLTGGYGPTTTRGY